MSDTDETGRIATTDVVVSEGLEWRFHPAQDWLPPEEASFLEKGCLVYAREPAEPVKDVEVTLTVPIAASNKEVLDAFSDAVREWFEGNRENVGDEYEQFLAADGEDCVWLSDGLGDRLRDYFLGRGESDGVIAELYNTLCDQLLPGVFDEADELMTVLEDLLKGGTVQDLLEWLGGS